MDILRTRLVAWALDRAQGDGRYTIPYLVADPDDRYGYRHRPLADRAEVYRHSGIDLQDAARLPQDPARAMGCLVRFRERRYAGINPAPGDLWRLASIASGYGDPTGRTRPEALPEADASEWRPVIDWLRMPSRLHGPAAYDPRKRA